MKDDVWFRHDANARHDPKIKRLRRECTLGDEFRGVAAKGLYWDIVEMLRVAGGRMRVDDAAFEVTDDNHLSEYGLAFSVIRDSGLFEVTEDGWFSSARLNEEIRFAEERAARNRDNGQKGGRPRKETQNKPTQNPQETEQKPSGFLDKTQTKPTQNHNNNNNNNNIISSLHSEIDNNISSLHSDMPLTPEKLEVLVSGEPIEKGLTDAQCKEVVSLWNSIVKRSKATYSTVVAISEERKNQIRIRWKEFEKVGNPWQVCETIFHKACASNFLQGEGSKGWKANFDWIFHNGKNWPKIYEGVYDNKTAPGTPEQGGFMGRLATQLQEIDEYYSNPDNGNTKTTDNAGPDEQQFGW